jgi:predicted dienelactone hydrolase
MKKLVHSSLFTIIAFCSFSQHQIGHTTITFNDPARTGGFGSGGGAGRQIQTEIYYPATTAGENTTVAPGEFPIIVFGHGFAMTWEAYANIWEHYAPMGYILAFPRTEGSLFPTPSHGDFGLDLNVVETRMQAEDVLATSLFFQKINGNSALMGHSMGGGATILGASVNTSIKAVVGLAPAESDPSAIAAASNVTVPAIIFSGGQDGVTPPDEHHIPIYDDLSSACKTFVNIVGGAHCYFANTNFNCDFGEGTSSSGISITRAEQQTRTFGILDYWLAYQLMNDNSAWTTFQTSLSASPTTLITETTCSFAGLDEEETEQLVFSPNPTNSIISFVNTSNEKKEISIFNASGQILTTKEVQNQVDFSQFEAGIYFLQLNGRTYKIIKE